MRTDTAVDTPRFLVKHRVAIILISMVLLLPPLAAIFQVSGDTSFCGTWCPRMFFSWRKGMSGADFLMGFARSYLGVALVAGILVISFFFGRYWCSHACPVGGVMELGSRITPRWMRIDFSGIPAAPVRYGYLLAYLLAPVLGIGSLCCSYCNFAVVPRIFGAAFSPADAAYFLRTAGLINLGLVLLLGFFSRGGRAYCNFFCPIGAFDAIANRLGQAFGKRFRIDPSRCTSCGDCVRACPTWAISGNPGETIRIDQLSCMPCGACESVCPRGAVSYGKPEK